jgi:hypothetical protein
MNEIKKGTKLFRERNGKFQEVEVYDIFFEKYISGWKTIIMVFKTGEEWKLLESYFASDLGNKLLVEPPVGDKNV